MAEEEVKEKRKVGRPKGSYTVKKMGEVSKREAEKFVQAMNYREKMEMTAEQNARFVGNTLELVNLPRIDLDYPDSVKRRVNEYFEICIKNNIKPSVAGLSLSLHTNRTHFIAICNGEAKAAPETRDILCQARNALNELLENYLIDKESGANTIGAIVIAKNNFGYKDQNDVVVHNDGQFNAVDTAELRNKYLADTIDDTLEIETAEEQ